LNIPYHKTDECFVIKDGTIDKLPTNNPNIIFIKKNINYDNIGNTTNLHDLININNSIFIKMDIEGSEVNWIKSLNNEQMNKFEQIVMEFHNPFTENEIDVFEKINNNHYLVHFHPNNCCGVTNHKNTIIPNIVECTYLHKKYFKNIPKLNNVSIPKKIDMKNLIEKDDIYINYPPFVYSTLQNNNKKIIKNNNKKIIKNNKKIIKNNKK
jgi:hypothetical protein